MALLPGTFNSRALGGLPASDGSRVRAGALVRSDAPVALGDAGRARVEELGIGMALDLREPAEQRLDPPDLPPTVTVIAHPILGPDLELGLTATLEDVYRQLIDSRGARLAGAVAEIAVAGGPALVFCSAGKDRTGLVVGLALAAVGVAPEAIVADYHRSEANLRGEFRTAVEARAVAAGIPRQALATKLGAPAELMTTFLGWLDAEYGGAAGFLTGHGIGPEQQRSLRGALLGRSDG